MPRTAAIIQARTTSTRLPRKVLLQLAGTTVLDHVIRRAKAIAGIDIVCCAVPESAEHDPVAEEAERCDAAVFRGPEEDLLKRYLGAAQGLQANVIMRITSDCPLIDPAVCAAVLTLRRNTDSDYACNNMPPSFPHGLDCEAFTTAALERADAEAGLSHEREHVTPWLRTQPNISRANLSNPAGNDAHLRWTLDYPEDLEFFRAIYRDLPDDGLATTTQVKQILAIHPELTAINAFRHDTSRPTKSS